MSDCTFRLFEFGSEITYLCWHGARLIVRSQPNSINQMKGIIVNNEGKNIQFVFEPERGPSREVKGHVEWENNDGFYMKDVSEKINGDWKALSDQLYVAWHQMRSEIEILSSLE